MKLGLITNCLGQCPIDEAEAIAVDLGLDCLEVGPTVPLDVDAFKAVRDRGRIEIASLMYCRNVLDPHEKTRDEFRSETERRIRFCMDAGVPQFTMITGVQSSKTLDENIELFRRYYGPIFREGAEAGLRFALEFCPGMGTFAAGPAQWRRMFQRVTDENFGLNYDPSHLVWEMIDYLKPIPEFAQKIFSVHAKDTEVFPERLAEHGCLQLYREPHAEGDAFWWNHRIPGAGQIDWATFFGALRDAGFDGCVNIELEDPDYFGGRERALEGARKSIAALDRLGIR